MEKEQRIDATAAAQPDFRALFESLPGLYLVVLPDLPRYTIVAASDALARATRTTRAEIVGRGLFEAFPGNPSSPETSAAPRQAASLAEVIQTRASDAVDVCRHDLPKAPEEGGGFEERWWRTLNAPLLGPNGELSHILCRVEDVTELMRSRPTGDESALLLPARELEVANRELRRASEEISRLVEQAPDGVFVADLTGRYTSVNAAACRMLGYSREELIGRTILDLIPAEDASRLTRSREELLAGGSELSEWTLRKKDGSYLPVEVNAKILPDGRWQAFVRDISDRKRLENALRLAYSDLERAQSVAQIGSWRMDIQRNQLSWTDENYRIFGVAKGTPMTYEAFLACVHPDDRAYVDHEWNAALGGAPYDIEHRLLVDGEVRWVREKAELHFDERGALLGGIGITQDLTDRKLLEQALHATNADLNRAQAVAQIGSWRLDVQRNVLSWTDENYRIFGVAKGTPMTYEAFLACVHPDDRAYVDREWNAALGGAPYDIEHRLLVDGKVKWVREKAELEFDRRGALLGGVGITQDVTERKRHEAERRRAEEHLRETRERFELALEGAQAAWWDWNVKTGEVVFNPRWATMRGYRPEELRPHVDAWIEGLHPDDRPRVEKALADHFAGLTETYRLEHRVRTRSGDRLWILDLGKVFARDEQGQPVRMVGVELDITERVRLEQELRLAEARASGIVSISADAIISVDEDQRITLFNEGAERTFGYSRSEALGAPLGMLLPERHREVHRRHVERFAAAPEISRRMGGRQSDVHGRRKNGEEFPAEATLSKLEIGGRRILTVALRDVTEQRRVEREQRLLAEVGAIFASTLDYEETLTNVARSIVRELADLCIVDLLDENEKRALTVVARSPEHEELCERVRQLHARHPRPEFATRVLTTRRAVLVEHVSSAMLASLAPADEHVKILQAIDPRSILAVPLLAHGNLLGVMTFFSTTSPRHYGPIDLPLVEEIAYRAALAIENARLYRAAGRAIRARDEVLGIVAHDLRNPLGAILMQASLLQRAPSTTDSCRSSADAVKRAAARMNRMIQDLLDVARIEAGRLAVERHETHTHALLADALEAQRPRASAAGVELRPVLGPELPEVLADRERLLQVFDNLIDNALKFTKPGGVVTVSATPRGGEVLFSVADTGAGIPPDHLPHVFDRFWQGRGTGRHGAGLGLAIVKGIVEEHGGRVWAESDAGRGTTFFFTISTAPSAVATRTSAAPDRPSANP